MSSTQTQTPAALINSCQGLVRSIAWKLHQRLPSSVDLDDLIGFGQLGLAEAARDFDQQRGTQFTTYAYYRVRGAILDGLSSMNWFSKADYARGRYDQSANDLLENSGSQSEANDADWFRHTTRTVSMSYLMTRWGNTEVPEPEDTVTPSDMAETADLQVMIRRLVSDLPEQERKLIEGVYFEGLTIKDAGERVGVSKAWASRLHARTLESLALRLSSDED